MAEGSTFHEKDVLEESHLLEDFRDEAKTRPVEAESSNPSPALHINLSGLQHPQWSDLIPSSKRFLFFLLPTFIQTKLYPDLLRPVRLHPSAYLDGMRGLAALFVFFYHFSYSSHDVLTAFAGTGKPDEHREFLKLPFIRFIYTGPAMVSIFYVVSGYALSYKPVKLMRNKSWKDLLHTLSSATFRRAVRLYLPCFASTLMILVLVRLGAYDATRGIAYDERRLDQVREFHMPRYRSLWHQITDWAKMIMEFRSSLVLYLTQLGLARLKPLVRILSLVALIVWCHEKDRWEMILFYSGFLLAELDFRRQALAATKSLLPTLDFSLLKSSQRQSLWTALYIFVFLVGIYLGGQPQSHVEYAPGWATLYSWIPSYCDHKQRYWVGWAAILLVWSTSNSALLQRLFTNGPVQYLGKISFSLYLMHGPVTHTIGYASMEFFWRIIGDDTYMTKEIGFVLAAIINIASTIWAADLFMRVVDTPTVQFAKWIEEKCIVPLE
ncbi:unnamed protein product [Aureobasidium vineae]|uniref:Acyltransferase 3 domain-containing protein n=1 Tax=Aureobasidium vineae TaxID=2773715 RepID=A0A9N8J6F0_9PEZI|nr:unnamed protein product [Aureobasidium vineae]